MKPLLPHSSGHSKLVKRGIANLCLKNALDKSCFHKCEHSLLAQANRLGKAGYPLALVTSVASKLLRDVKRSLRN